MTDLSQCTDVELRNELSNRKEKTSTTLAFRLSMPGCPSWDGKWSGDGTAYIIVKNIGRSKASLEKMKKILTEGRFYYAWDDGWRACVSVKKIGLKEAKALKKKSAGFCGYDWMVDSILQNQYIKID